MADSTPQNQVQVEKPGVEPSQQSHTVNMNNLNNTNGQNTEQTQNQALIPNEQAQGKSKFVFFKRVPAGPPKVRPPLGMNAYAQKKTMAQGFMDMALLTANAAQMKLIMVEGKDGRFPFFDFIMALLGISVVFQIVVGALLLYKSQYNIEHQHDQHRADRANNWATGLVMLITVLNVFISAFIMLDDSRGGGATGTGTGTGTATTMSPPAVPQAPATAPIATSVGFTTTMSYTTTMTSSTSMTSLPHSTTCVCPTP